MIILAWNGGSLSDIFDAGVFKKVLSIFITAAILKLGQGKMHLLEDALVNFLKNMILCKYIKRNERHNVRSSSSNELLLVGVSDLKLKSLLKMLVSFDTRFKMPEEITGTPCVPLVLL